MPAPGNGDWTWTYHPEFHSGVANWIGANPYHGAVNWELWAGEFPNPIELQEDAALTDDIGFGIPDEGSGLTCQAKIRIVDDSNNPLSDFSPVKSFTIP
jgi:hypothetical protein